MSGHALRYDPATVREAYAAAALAFARLAGEVADEATLEQPGLGEWTVRDLLGHTSRALTTVTGYLAAGVGMAVALQHPLDYASVFAAAAAEPGSVADRGRATGAELGLDVAAEIQRRVDDAVSAVSDHPDDAPVATPAGVMRLVDYLPSRIFELVVHSDDLARAAGAPLQQHEAAVEIALTYAAGLAAIRPDAEHHLRALVGRDEGGARGSVVG